MGTLKYQGEQWEKTRETPGGGTNAPSLPVDADGGSTRPEGGEIGRRRRSTVGESEGGEPPPRTAAEAGEALPPVDGAIIGSASSMDGQLEGGWK